MASPLHPRPFAMSPDPALTISFIKKDIFEPNFKSRDSACLPNPNWFHRRPESWRLCLRFYFYIPQVHSVNLPTSDALWTLTISARSKFPAIIATWKWEQRNVQGVERNNMKKHFRPNFFTKYSTLSTLCWRRLCKNLYSATLTNLHYVQANYIWCA